MLLKDKGTSSEAKSQHEEKVGRGTPTSLILSERAMDPQHESVLQGAELNPSLIELFYQNKSECKFIHKIWFVPGILNREKKGSL